MFKIDFATRKPADCAHFSKVPDDGAIRISEYTLSDGAYRVRVNDKVLLERVITTEVEKDTIPHCPSTSSVIII